MSHLDSLKALARHYDMTAPQVREIAHDLDLFIRYSKNRRCWFIDEKASVVVMFNDHLSNLVAS